MTNTSSVYYGTNLQMRDAMLKHLFSIGYTTTAGNKLPLRFEWPDKYTHLLIQEPATVCFTRKHESDNPISMEDVFMMERPYKTTFDVPFGTYRARGVTGSNHVSINGKSVTIEDLKSALNLVGPTYLKYTNPRISCRRLLLDTDTTTLNVEGWAFTGTIRQLKKIITNWEQVNKSKG